MEPAETVAALYEAVLGRAPDAGGLEYYTNAINNGASAADVRASLAYSPEAQSLIENVYKTDLGRAADAGGKQFYTERLATGGLLSDVKASVQDSPEARGLLGGTTAPVTTAPVTTAPVVKPPVVPPVVKPPVITDYTQFTNRLNSIYQNAFGRNADAEGLKFYGDMLASGASDADITASLKGSPEYANLLAGRAKDAATEAASPAGQLRQRGIAEVPFGSQIIGGQVRPMAQYGQPAAQAGAAPAGTGMGSPSLQGFLANNPSAAGLTPFQQSLQYQAALPSMIQPFNPAATPATYQQQLTPTPRLDISSTAIPSWLQTAINAQRTKDGITLTEQDKFTAANPTVTNSGLGPVVKPTITPTVTPTVTPGVTPTVTPSTTGGLLAATQISPDILNAYGDYLGRTADLPGASYWQTRANQGMSIADVIANISGSPEGLLYAPIRADKLAAANAPYIAPPE
jgi:hypothetical protein